MTKSNNTKSPSSIAQDMLNFIERSPTPFHATSNLVSLFTDAGFTRLEESAEWQCKGAGKYVVTRNDSSIIAFIVGDNLIDGVQMVGAHTDSPCLKIKPNPEITNKGYQQLGIQVYGGALLHPWLDRDLSVAGRVSGVTKKGELFHQLIDFENPIAVIPNLAIHLDRYANKDKTINPQTHLPLIIGDNDNAKEFKQLLLEYCDKKADRVLDFELSCYDTQAPNFVGLNQEFIASARLDNLLSSYIGALALINSKATRSALFVATDHEEVGSASACGAQGPFLRSVLERLTECVTPSNTANQTLRQIIANSILVSCDNAHGIHPNYTIKHDKNHGPILNQGVVIKTNASQRYASNSVSSARFQQICEKAKVPTQAFVVRADMSCGSTIGPITAAELGIETLDIGVPQWAMHSIRETAGSKDIDYLHRALKAFYNH